MWKTLSHVRKYQNKWMSTWEDSIEFPDKSNNVYGYIKIKDGVCAVPVDPRNNIILFKEYRYPFKKMMWSLPGGAIDKNEKPNDAIKREIKEEIGVTAISIESVGKTWVSSPVFIFEKTHLYIARINTNPVNAGEKNEMIQGVSSFSVKEVLQMIDNGEIEDAYIANALQITCRKLS